MLTNTEREKFYRLTEKAAEVFHGMERWMDKHLDDAMANCEPEIDARLDTFEEAALREMCKYAIASINAHVNGDITLLELHGTIADLCGVAEKTRGKIAEFRHAGLAL